MCNSVTCSSRGVCHGKTANSSDYYCVCNHGYYGTDCQYNGTDPCDAQNCSGHGVCFVEFRHQDNTTDAKCECERLYSQVDFCSVLAQDICNQQYPCQHGGICTGSSTVYRDYTCDCTPGAWLHFPLAVVETRCDLLLLLFVCCCLCVCVCVCVEWTGKNCTIPFDVCKDQCGSGTCEPISGGHYFRCTCPDGYTGVKCAVPINHTEAPVVTSIAPPTSMSCKNFYQKYRCCVWGCGLGWSHLNVSILQVYKH